VASRRAFPNCESFAAEKAGQACLYFANHVPIKLPMPVIAAPVTTPFSREKLLQIARSLPADLQVLSELGEMLQDVNSDLEAIASLLRRDVALAARIVRISNSPMFGGAGQVGSVEEAVNRVGFSEILKLVGTATTARFAERSLEYYGISASALRDNLLFAAFAAEAVATRMNLEARTAYTAALLRTLGMMVLDRACRGQVTVAQRFSKEMYPNYSTWEGSVFGVNNCEVAGLILDEWRFPAEIGAAVRIHYLTRRSDADRPLALALNLANGLAVRRQRGLAGEAAWWEITAEKMRQSGLSEEDLDDAMSAAERAFDVAAASLAM
jgi:HD-like signal output (HDOD) protein